MDAKIIAIIGGLMGMLGWGICDFLAKKTVTKIGPLKTMIFVELISAVFLMVYLFKDSSLPDFSLSNIAGVALFGFSWALIHFIFLIGLQVGKASVVTPITSSYVVLSVLISFVFLKEPFNSTKIAVLAMVVLGVISTSLDIKNLKNARKDRKFARGVPEAIFCMIGIGILFPLWDTFMSQDGWIVLNILVKLFIAIVMILYANKIKRVEIRIKDPSAIPWVFGIALFEAIATGGISWSFNASADTTSIIVTLSSAFSLVTVLLAFFFLRERLHINQYIGIGLIVIGVSFMPLV